MSCWPPHVLLGSDSQVSVLLNPTGESPRRVRPWASSESRVIVFQASTRGRVYIGWKTCFNPSISFFEHFSDLPCEIEGMNRLNRLNRSSMFIENGPTLLTHNSTPGGPRTPKPHVLPAFSPWDGRTRTHWCPPEEFGGMEILPAWAVGRIYNPQMSVA